METSIELRRSPVARNNTKFHENPSLVSKVIWMTDRRMRVWLYREPHYVQSKVCLFEIFSIWYIHLSEWANNLFISVSKVGQEPDSSAVQRWATGWMSGGSSPAGAGNISLHHRVHIGSGAHPVSYRMGTRALSLEVKQPACEADHSPPSSAEVKNAWSYTSTPPIRLHGVGLS
jgi:hypothetical protein